MKLIFIKTANLFALIHCISIVSAVDVFEAEKIEESFPPNFKFGAATAAYQIEGAWNLDGKGNSIWDEITHQHPEKIADHSSGDIGPDSYHLFEEDIKALKQTKFQFYRFSLSWSRLFPNGDVSSLNQAAVKYYNTLINRLIENGIQPMVTLYHYDLPNYLQKFGGLTNSIIIEYFREYADFCFKTFGDRVPWWITFNEPFDFCVDGYGSGITAPLVNTTGVGEYLCIDNILTAHAAAYHTYHNNYHRIYKNGTGKVGITLSGRGFFDINDPQAETTRNIERALQFNLGWLLHPIFSKSGGYPPEMIRTISSNSLRENRLLSRLPKMDEKKMLFIRGSADFLGYNYYTSRIVSNFNTSSDYVKPSWDSDLNLKMTVDPNWKRAKSSWLYQVPEGLTRVLNWFKDRYDNPEVIITENGWSSDGDLNDPDRIEYINLHLQAVLKAIKNGCEVTGYTVWSIIDNFEWLKGYTEKFGLYRVDFSSPNRTRTPRKSADFMRTVIETRSIPKY